MLQLLIELEEIYEAASEEDKLDCWPAEAFIDGGYAHVGLEKFRLSTFEYLLAHVCLTEMDDNLYCINSTGREIVKNPDLADEIYCAIMKGDPFTTTDGKVVLI